MLALAAFPLGYKVRIFEPESHCPASLVTPFHTCANYEDDKALIEFAKSCDVVTFEFENIPLGAAALIEKHAQLFPSSKALELTQDRLVEKEFIRSLGLKVAPYRSVHNFEELNYAISKIGPKGILKARMLGYDGKGQALVNGQGDAASAWQEIAAKPAVFEALVEFEFETSAIIARGQNGQVLHFPNSQNFHKGGILRKSIVPAPMSEQQFIEAQNIAHTVAEALKYVGVMAVELFVTKSGLVVNEIAPRVHNSGHWTIEGCKTSQFAAHIHAICGLSLGDASLCANAIEMDNLLGDEILNAHELLAEPNIYAHIYGKEEVRRGRKMGHVTRLKNEPLC
ncbi:MAG: 5-(carboxyamino)imidazole ribonucleotide synthase [Hyphomonadaceae bacterium]|nr:MAG: 5-(carboxyamino)imidazole ribonucleotide synthase [Hyphomonadaceae bacterium]KAF0187135.1 MAG: 5-(carboxyamino)imidazole ribonucleotide synthase [Hyphomonadaceae bacterium]